MIEIFSSDLEDVFKHIQENIDDPDGFLFEEMSPTSKASNKFWEYKVLQKYKYDNGKPFMIISRKLYRVTGTFDFCVMFDIEWYKNATESQLDLISDFAVNVRNREFKLPMFMYSYTFNEKIAGDDCYNIRKCLEVIYTDCVIGGSEELYNKSKYNEFAGCIFTGNEG